MELNYKEFGSGRPLLILHGLFGSLDNWQTLAKRFADDFHVFTIDQRNHGKSPHTEEFSYEIMANDVANFIEQNNLEEPVVLGHSMGGKTSMYLANQFPELVGALISVDMAPRVYQPGHNDIFEALFSVEFDRVKSRSDADEQIADLIPQLGVRQFLLKNLKRKENGSYEWKFNLPAIHQAYDKMVSEFVELQKFEKPTLFIKGENSGYIRDKDEELIKLIYPNAQVVGIENAGHWVHAEQPAIFYKVVSDFLANN